MHLSLLAIVFLSLGVVFAIITAYIFILAPTTSELIYIIPVFLAISSFLSVVLTLIGLAMIFGQASFKHLRIDFKKSLKFLLTIIVVISIAIILWNIMRVLLGSDIPLVVVKSRSMYPTLDVGDLLVIKKSESFEIGDIIVFRQSRDIVVHRIYNITSEGIMTKGDAYNKPDPWIIKPFDIYGKVITIIPRVGYLLLVLSNPAILLIVIALTITILLLRSVTFISRSETCPFFNEKCTFGGFNPRTCQVCLMVKQLLYIPRNTPLGTPQIQSSPMSIDDKNGKKDPR
ncbi:MAG: signal peptidase I [Desulfurococcaceae archaeon]|nr:signal peptidase I [Desulfurococcaceae archaeon]